MEALNKLCIQPQDEFEERIKSTDVTEYKNSAHIKLADFQEHLEVADKKCKLMKNRLEYMKMVYQSVGFGRIEKIAPDMFSLNSSNSILNDNHDIHDPPTRKKDEIEYHDNIGQVDNENLPMMIDTTNIKHSVRSKKNKSKNYFSTNKKENKRKKSLNQLNQTAKISRESVSAAPITSTKFSSSTNDLNNNENMIERQRTIIMSPSTTKTTKKSEIILKIAGAQFSTYNGDKSQKADKTMKIIPTSSSVSGYLKVEQNNIDNISTSRTEKVRKRKTRMRSTNSRNISVNRTAYIIQKIQPMSQNKTHVKKISQSKLNNVTATNFIIENQTTEQKLNEVVEIYHNIAAKNKSPSVVSSKQQFKIEELKCFQLKNDPVTSIEINNKGTIQHIVNASDKIKNQNTNHFHTEMKQNIYNSPDLEWSCSGNQEKSIPLSMKHHHGDCDESVTPSSWCNNTLTMKSYQQPTISSELKRVNRCYFGARVNLTNIPFVVGTSLTPSHNLGLNIQQIFSLIKHRQLTMSSNIKPILISKMGEGIDPNVLLSEQLMVVSGKQKRVMSSKQVPQQDTQHDDYGGSFKKRNNSGDSREILMHITQSSMLRQREKDLNMTKKCQSMTNNFTRIRNVLTKLQDQFEAMLNKHEKLTVQVEKANNPSLKKELTELEGEIDVKGEEISAMMGLYKEILALKHEMKLLRGKNSVICITTHSNEKYPTRINGSSISARQSRIPHQHLRLFNCRKPTTVSSIREPTTTSRLVALLKRIQLYQQRLIDS
ncbi:hypothetical protein PV327_008006 [Microctonus hyperodae]|uniref:Uncharacterized protein n=1 Tax=Microctonus hyperodae TaxID=165561 RepID=A0AA39G0D6_MICHY|nr:hypothetical protein PV327_008006 [Microctonus hyperodae]